ncbi:MULTISPECIES: hypothetical protein [Trueperella]|uniref:Uncharacterized protein n=1 Tax=Trueperella pecoris TaxID=2733571 RepID=A0A7M1QVX7_9ACTO|nr:hypothetical protein [Trueperella pecoris]QOR45475.1 hypothetical protein INS88_09485 [Trueperella pecoris]
MHTWPPARAHINTDATTTVTLAGITRTLSATSITDGRTKTRELLASWANHLGRPITAQVTDPEGTWTITVDGTAAASDVTTPTSTTRKWWKK